jgi:cytochrome oxidase Cu insertion factor (SCO1/SenC/PrrC family)
VFGSSNPYSPAGETQINVSTRNLRSSDHYNGTVEQVARQTADTYVVNLQHMVDVNLSHNFSSRFSASVGVPFINSSWGIPMPLAGGRAARVDQVGRGLGDISASGRAWVLPTGRFTSGNIAVGLGVKMPTGNSNAKATYPNIAGTNPQLKPVDQSVQPGDGGWGLTVDLSGFKRIPYATLFGSASYLANPRNRNNTTAIGYNISAAAVPPINADGTSYNSVPDQFMARLGGAVPIGSTGFACSLAWRVEGVPRYDLFGESRGFRRPGVEMFIEPGASYAKGSHVYSVQVPIGYYRNRFRNPYTGNRGDATFPKYIVLASYGYRFGGKSTPNASLPATTAPAPGAVVVGSSLKPFKLKTLDGASKTLANVLGKATLVVFFYPTCAFCNAAGPEIQRLHDTYKAQGLSVVYINAYPDEEKLVPGWLDKHRYTVPVLVGAKLEDVQRDYDVQATPTHYLLDAKGLVLAKHSGYQAGDAAALEQEIQNALKIAAGSR